MKTEIFKNRIGNAAEIIKNGGIVAVPTETVYGLAANGLNADAVRKIYEVKGRPEVKPISLLISGPEDIDRYCVDVPSAAKKLAQLFFPGPLTIVLKSSDFVPLIVRANGQTIGVRCPSNDLTLQLIKESNVPLAAPSANPSGSVSPKSGVEVINYFDGIIDCIIDDGNCSLGFESTIIDLSKTPYSILREGALPVEKIENALIDCVKIIGITGPTGSGKSTALKEIKSHNGLILDCDKIYHSLLESNSEMINEIKLRFPDSFDNSKINRKKLASIVFNDSASLLELNKITHKYVSEDVKSRIKNYALNGGTLAAIDAVELVSSGLNKLCNKTVAVLSDSETRLKRIMLRDGISKESAKKRILSGRQDEYYNTNCDVCIENNDSEEIFLEKFSREVKLYE